MVCILDKGQHIVERQRQLRGLADEWKCHGGGTAVGTQKQGGNNFTIEQATPASLSALKRLEHSQEE
jgi:hypothetical protein